MSINKYSPEMKARAVAEWRAGTPFKEVMAKYKITGTGLLSAWAKRLDAGKQLHTAPQSTYAGNKHSPELKRKVLDALAAGKPIRAVAKEHGVHKTTVEHWKAEGTNLPVPVSNQSKYSPAIKAQALELSSAPGANMKAVAAQLNVPVGIVYAWRSEAKKKGGAVVPAINGGSNGSQQLNIVASAVATRDATIFLKKAKIELLAGIRSGVIHDFDNVHLMSMLALNSLTGGK